MAVGLLSSISHLSILSLSPSPPALLTFNVPFPYLCLLVFIISPPAAHRQTPCPWLSRRLHVALFNLLFASFAILTVLPLREV